MTLWRLAALDSARTFRVWVSLQRLKFIPVAKREAGKRQ